MFITAKLLDVETARTIMTDNVMMGTTADEIQEGCKTLSEKLFSNTPTNKTSSKVAAKASATQIPEMSNVEIGTEMLIVNSKSDQKLLGVKKYSYGNYQMDERAFREFLYKNHSRAYADYMKGKKLVKAGWWTMGAGFLLAIPIGCGLLDVLWEEELAAFWGIGGAAVVSSIPILGVGYAKRNRAYDLRNYSYIANYCMTKQPAVSLVCNLVKMVLVCH